MNGGGCTKKSGFCCCCHCRCIIMRVRQSGRKEGNANAVHGLNGEHVSRAQQYSEIINGAEITVLPPQHRVSACLLSLYSISHNSADNNRSPFRYLVHEGQIFTWPIAKRHFPSIEICVPHTHTQTYKHLFHTRLHSVSYRRQWQCFSS